MRTYLIHADKAFAEQALNGASAARLGFSGAALVFGPFFLLFAGAWSPVAAYAIFAAIVVAAAVVGLIGAGAALLLFALGNVFLAFEGHDWVAWSRARAGYAAIDIVFAESAIEAERRFLERAGTAPATRAPLAKRDDEVIGLFPEPGR